MDELEGGSFIELNKLYDLSNAANMFDGTAKDSVKQAIEKIDALIDELKNNPSPSASPEKEAATSSSGAAAGGGEVAGTWIIMKDPESGAAYYYNQVRAGIFSMIQYSTAVLLYRCLVVCALVCVSFCLH